MRKHRRGILVGIIIFIGIPFVFFVPGVDFLGGDPNQLGYPEVIAQVGDRPISSIDFRAEYDRVARARAQDGVYPTAQQLTQDGTVEQILESLINSQLLAIETEKYDYTASEDYLVEMLREMPQFQKEDGTFDAAYYNQWVRGNDGANWNGIYDELNTMLNRQVFGSLVSASARVFESDLRKQFLDRNTTIRVKYAAIEPPVELTEEEIRAHYDENIDTYNTAEERVAQFVAIPLEAPMPPVLDDIMTRAHAGEDFGQLARQFSEGPQKASGGDIGWITPTASVPDHQKILFDMAVGQISDPVRGPNAVHIYKVAERRPSTLAGREDVRVQEILLRPQLSEEEKAERVARAQAIIDAANESGDLAAAAEAAGLEIQTTSAFSRTSTAIDNINDFDVFAFRRDTLTLAPDTVSGVIEGRNNLYVAKITEVIEPQQQEFETVREQVEQDAIAAYRQTPEYQAAVERYIAEIEEKAESIEQIQELFPELGLQINETTEPFSRTDFLFQQGARFQAAEAFAALEDKEPGELAGPIADFSGVEYYIELIERNEPTEEMWAEQWPEERKTLREQALRNRAFEHQQDFFQYLREQADENFLIQEDWAAIAQVIDYGAQTENASQTPIQATEQPLDNPEVAPLEFDAPTGDTEALPPVELTLPVETVEETTGQNEAATEASTGETTPDPDPSPDTPTQPADPPTETPTPNN